MPNSPECILTLSCADTIGIVHAVSGFLLAHGCNIIDSAQFGERGSGRFFMRVCFEADAGLDAPALRRDFQPIAERFRMEWALQEASFRPRLLIMVSRFGHCLNDLLYRHKTNALNVEIPAIVSNHEDFRWLAETHTIPFHHLPVTPANKAEQERALMALVEREAIDLVVLARYMQVLSTELCNRMSGRIINIHHSFLPSFKGARPYEQAHARGVKLVGATAHYVTADLDEGPIIEQDVLPVSHGMTPDDLAAAGRDVEAAVLSRAIKLHIERRVFLNGLRTVVFR